MSLLSFRAPVLYAACYRCGNPLTHGEDECPHCGTNQSRALRTVGGPNAVDYGSNVVLMPGRMLVPYPSVPEEIDTAMNIARERKRVLKQVAFYLASAGMLAMALGLAYAPALRSPVVQRLAALPEPAARKPMIVPPVPLAPEDNADVAAAASATVLAAASSTTVQEAAPVSQAVVSTVAQTVAQTVTQAPSVMITQAAPATVAPKTEPTQPTAANVVKQAAVEKPKSVVPVTPPVIATPKAIEPSVVAEAHPNKTAELISSASIMAISALATVEAQAQAFNAQVSNTYDSLLAMATAAIHPAASDAPSDTLVTSVAQNEAVASARSANPAPLASKPTTAALTPRTVKSDSATVSVAPTTIAQAPAIPAAKPQTKTTTTTPAIPPAPVVATTAAASPRPAPPAPSPTATADVPIASHAPQPSALTENGLPRMSMAPISPAMTAERPPAGSPGETLYIARLALLTNDLSAARKNLAEVPSSLADDVEAKHIRDELAQRETARDTAMQRARACDAASSWRCARRYAKDAIAIDTSYPDSRVLLKRVNIKVAQAKKAADAAALLAANNAAHPVVHAAPIREAVAVSPVPRVPQQGTYAAPLSPSNSNSTSTSTSNNAPHLFATPPARTTRESRETHESHGITYARETRPFVETREIVAAPAPAKNPDQQESESRVYGGGVPIRPPGRGEAH